jgi:hypothetical protein
MSKLYDELLDKTKDLNDYQLVEVIEFVDKLKHKRPKRSLNANNYLWQIIQQVADVLNSTKEDVYKHLIQTKGQFEILPIKDEAVQTFIKCWSKNGLGNICEIKGKSKLEGYTNVICYFGTSSYDSKQFHAFTEYLVSEANELGIETRTPDEIAMMERS